MENCLILKNQPIDFIVISSRDDPPLLLGRSVGVSLYIYIVEMWERTTWSKCNPAHQNRWTQELCRRLALHWKFQFLQSSTEVWKFGPPYSQSSITLCKTMQYLVPTVVGCPRGTKTTRYWHLWVTVHQFLRRLIDLETQEAHTHSYIYNI